MENDAPSRRENQEERAKRNLLEEIIREGARKLLQAAIEQEVSAYVEQCKDVRDEKGRRSVVRHGHLPERSLLTGIGPLQVKQPRVRDKREGMAFTSAILPRYLRRVPSLDTLIPTLYLKGISTGDFTEALEAILGEQAKGLSASTVVRLKRQWEEDYKGWAKRDLTGKRYVYFWADGIYFNVRLEDTENKRQCFLIIIGALEDGTRAGCRARRLPGEQALWMELLASLRNGDSPKGRNWRSATAGSGFWAALGRCILKPENSGAGSTKRRTSSTRCRRRPSQGQAEDP
jgi:transposase-like protein